MQHLGIFCRFLKPIGLLAVFWLAGCATTPHHNVIIAPININTTATSLNKANIRLSTNDKRADSNLVRIVKSDGSHSLFASNNSPYSLLSNALRQGLAQQGYVLSQQTGTTLNLNLEDLIVHVEQNATSYKAVSLASATLAVNHNNLQLVKRYKAKGQTTGAMAIDTASLERELNDRLSQLLHAILNDHELHQFIR